MEEDEINDQGIVEGGQRLRGISSGGSKKAPPEFLQHGRNDWSGNITAPSTVQLQSIVGPSDYGNSSYDEQGFSIDQVSNLEDTRSQIQPFSHKVGVGLGTFAAKTATAFAGGVGNIVYGTVAAIHDQKFRSFWDNALMNGIEGVNEDIDKSLQLYRSEQERNGSFGDQIAGPGFWLKDIMGDGLSFTAGAVLSGMTIGGAVGMLGKVLSPMARAISGTAKVLKTTAASLDGLEAAAQGINTINKSSSMLGRVGTLGKAVAKITSGAVYESGVEALGFTKEAKAFKMQELNDKYGEIDTPEKRAAYDAELQKFDDDITGAANGVFATNMALVSASQIVTLPQIFGVGAKGAFSGARKFLRMGAKVTEEGAEDVVEVASKGALKGFGGRPIEMAVEGGWAKAGRVAKNFTKAGVMEGMVEEGGQNFTKNMALEYVKKQYDQDSFNTQYDFAEAFGTSFQKAYGSKEGWKEIMAGVIIGSLGAPNLNARATVKNEDGTESKEKRSILSLDANKSHWVGGILGNFQEDFDNRAKAQQLVNEHKTVREVVDWLQKHDSVNGSVLNDRIKSFQHQHASKAEQDDALVHDDFFTYQNAKHDIFHQYVKTMVDAGMKDEIQSELIAPMMEMNPKEFKDTFGVIKKDGESDEQAVDRRKSEVVKSATERVAKIARAVNMANTQLDFDTTSEEGKLRRDMYVYALSTMDNVKERIESVVKESNDSFTKYADSHVHDDTAYDSKHADLTSALAIAKDELSTAATDEEIAAAEQKVAKVQKLVNKNTSDRESSKISETLSKSTFKNIPHTVAAVEEALSRLQKSITWDKSDDGKITPDISKYTPEDTENITELFANLNDLRSLMRRKEETFELYATANNTDNFKNFYATSRVNGISRKAKEAFIKSVEEKLAKTNAEAAEEVAKGTDPEVIEDKTGIAPEGLAKIIAKKDEVLKISKSHQLNGFLRKLSETTGHDISSVEDLISLIEDLEAEDSPESEVMVEFLQSQLDRMNKAAEKKANKVITGKSTTESTSTATKPVEGISQSVVEDVVLSPTDINTFTKGAESSLKDENSFTQEQPSGKEKNILRSAWDKVAYLAVNYVEKFNPAKKTRVKYDTGVNSKASKLILDPDVIKLVDKVTIEIDKDYSGEVTINGENKDYKSLTKEQQSHEDIVPIKIVYKGETIGYLHAPEWVNEANVIPTVETESGPVNNIDLQKSKLVELRRSVISSGGSLDASINHIGDGKLIRSENNAQQTSSEALPGAIFALSKEKVLIGHDSKNVINELDMTGPCAVIPINSEKEIVVPVTPKAIQADHAKVLARAFNLFLKCAVLKNPSKAPLATKEELAEFKELREKVLAAYKGVLKGGVQVNFDISTEQGIRNFMSVFIHAKEFDAGFTTVKTNNSTKTAFGFSVFSGRDAEDTHDQNTVFLSIGSANNLRLLKVQEQRTKGEESTLLKASYTTTYKISVSENGDGEWTEAGEGSIDEILGLFTNTEFGQISFTANKHLFGQKVSTPTINDEGKVEFSKSIEYSEHVGNNTTTNLMSINVGTEEKPKYAYTAQRTIGFEPAAPVAKVEETKKSSPALNTTPVTSDKAEAKASDSIEGVNDEIEIDDFSEDLSSNASEVDSAVKSLLSSEDLGTTVGEYMKSLDAEGRSIIRKNINELNPKCK